MTLKSFMLVFVLVVAATAQDTKSAKSAKVTPEQRTAKYMESVRNQPPALRAFLLRMPKGGDLHNHLTGATYAESYILWASDLGLCVDNATLTLVAAKQIAGEPPCESKMQRPAADALRDPVLYRN